MVGMLMNKSTFAMFSYAIIFHFFNFKPEHLKNMREVYFGSLNFETLKQPKKLLEKFKMSIVKLVFHLSTGRHL